MGTGRAPASLGQTSGLAFFGPWPLSVTRYLGVSFTGILGTNSEASKKHIHIQICKIQHPSTSFSLFQDDFQKGYCCPALL